MSFIIHISKKLAESKYDLTRQLWFHCPGCNELHTIRVEGDHIWGWNNDVDKPTFTPSIKVTWPANPNASERFKEWRKTRICHSFITDGMIQFLNDSTHALAGQTVELPDLPPD